MSAGERFERAVQAAVAANESNVRLLVLASRVTESQFRESCPGIAESLARAAVAAAAPILTGEDDPMRGGDAASPLGVGRLYRQARAIAADAAGGERAFRIIGSTLRTALVGKAILDLLAAQDESLPAERLRTLLVNLHDMLTDDKELLA